MTAQTKQVINKLDLVPGESKACFSEAVELTSNLVGPDYLVEHVAAVNELFPSLFPERIYPTNNLLIIDGLCR